MKDNLTFATVYRKLSASSHTGIYSVIAIIILIGLFVLWAAVGPTGTKGEILVRPGSSLTTAILQLEEAGVVRSSFAARVIAKLIGGSVKAGSYVFEGDESAYTAVKRLSRGDFQQELISITIPEGYTNKQITRLLGEKLPGFDTQQFEALASAYEGFLFPETYSFLASQTPEEVFSSMTSHFYSRYPNIATSTVILASIIEKEGKTPQDMKEIAGVLNKRLESGMALQVDASLSYYLPRSTYELTTEDLQTDHPYNTYMRVGLTPGPIANPGDAAIQAALHPNTNPYWYYVSDPQGKIYFSRTLAEHNTNVAKYMR